MNHSTSREPLISELCRKRSPSEKVSKICFACVKSLMFIHICQSQINSTSLFSKSLDFCTPLQRRVGNKNTKQGKRKMKMEKERCSTSEQLPTWSWQKFSWLLLVSFRSFWTWPARTRATLFCFLVLLMTFCRTDVDIMLNVVICHIHSSDCSTSRN